MQSHGACLVTSTSMDTKQINFTAPRQAHLDAVIASGAAATKPASFTPPSLNDGWWANKPVNSEIAPILRKEDSK